jgi:hypothetical protein
MFVPPKSESPRLNVKSAAGAQNVYLFYFESYNIADHSLFFSKRCHVGTHDGCSCVLPELTNKEERLDGFPSFPRVPGDTVVRPIHSLLEWHWIYSGV